MLIAQITEVKIGHLSLEGLYANDNQFYVAVPQLSEKFQFAKDHASRDLKALLGEDFQFAKIKTKLHSKAINAIAVKDFELVVFELAMNLL
jgi:hypothetical protein